MAKMTFIEFFTKYYASTQEESKFHLDHIKKISDEIEKVKPGQTIVFSFGRNMYKSLLNDYLNKRYSLPIVFKEEPAVLIKIDDIIKDNINKK